MCIVQRMLVQLEEGGREDGGEGAIGVNKRS